ncbi:hypothetical protein [Capybara microvirus Cap1_SP_119]|nr:hypothetical protein [Capybara microvirus Cap1_SP_119]
MSALSDILGFGTGVVSTGLNNLMNYGFNKLLQRDNQRIMDEQYKQNVELPTDRLLYMQSKGINPNSSQLSGSAASPIAAPSLNTTSFLNPLESKYLSAQVKGVEAESKLKEVQSEKVISDIEVNSQNIALLGIDLKFKEDLTASQLELLRNQVTNLQENTRLTSAKINEVLNNVSLSQKRYVFDLIQTSINNIFREKELDISERKLVIEWFNAATSRQVGNAESFYLRQNGLVSWESAQKASYMRKNGAYEKELDILKTSADFSTVEHSVSIFNDVLNGVSKAVGSIFIGKKIGKMPSSPSTGSSYGSLPMFAPIY